MRISTFFTKAKTAIEKNFAIVIVAFIVALIFLMPQHGSAQTFNDGYLSVFKNTSAAALASSGTAIVIEEYLPATAAQSAPNGSVAIPTTSGTPDTKLVCGGTTSSNGAMTRSQNGRYLIVPGYYNNVGDANSLYLTGAVRTLNAAGVVGVGVQGASWYSAANDFRGATSDDGTNYWLSGASLGIRYTNNGSTLVTVNNGTAGSSFTNSRVVNIFNNQLFYSTGSSTPATGVYQVGAGTPTTASITPTITAAPSAPYSFSVSPDGLTIYTVGTANTVVRYTYSGTYNSTTFAYSGGSWSAASSGFTLTAVTGLAVDWTGYSFSTGLDGAVVYACNTTTLVRGIDNGTGAITTTTLRTLTGNNAFKQLAFSPIKDSVSKGANSPAAGNITANTTNNVLLQFKLNAVEGNSTMKGLTIAQLGNATIVTSGTGGNITNFRLYDDVNNNGVFDAGTDTLVSNGTVSGSNIVFSNFSLKTYISQGSSRNYILLGDLNNSGGTNTFIPSIVSNKTLNSVPYTTNLVNAGGSWVNTGTNPPTGNTLTISGVVAVPTQLVVTSINPTSPLINTAFSVTVQAQDGTGAPANVTSNTSFTFSLNAGTGTLGGSTGGTITSGNNSVTVTGVTYNTAETGVKITTTGSGLTAIGSSAFTVLGVADHLALIPTVPTSGTTGAFLGTFTVAAVRADGSIDPNYVTDSIRIAKTTGTGALGGTFAKFPVSGQVSFTDLQLDKAGAYTLTVSSGTLTSATTGTITISSPSAFAAGDIAVLVAAASASNTTINVTELDTTHANQTPVNVFAMSGTGTDAVRASGSATSTLYLSNSNDGTLLSFDAVNSSNTAANTNTLNPRAVITLDNNFNFNLPTTYTGGSGNQPRSATSLDNSTWYIADQGGLYTNGSTTGSPTTNIRGIKAFGGIVYVGSSSTNEVSTVTAPSGGGLVALPGITTAAAFQDFTLISSGSNGTVYDVLYILDTLNNGTITKYSFSGGTWVTNGSYSFPTASYGFGLAARKTATGATLYMSTGLGATAANKVVKLYDIATPIFNTPINITTANTVTLYTAAAGAIIKGVALAPQTPVIAISPNHPAGGSILQGTSNNVIGAIKLVVSNNNTVLQSISVTSAGSYATTDFTNFRFWLSSSATSISGATQLGADVTPVGTGTGFSVSGLSNSLTAGNTYYILVTASVSTTATANNTISLTSTAFSNIGLSIGTKTGTDPVTATNTQTIANAVPSKIGLSITPTAPVGPVAGGTFNVTLKSLTSFNTPANVVANTTITITNVGGGTLSGTSTQGTITASSNQTTINNLSLSSSGTGVTLTAHVISGDGLSDSVLTITVYAAQPSTLASNIAFGTTTTTSIPVTWTSGNGTNEIVVARLTSTSAVAPINGTPYTANSSSFTDVLNGTTGTGNVIVYNGATPHAGTLTVSNLSAGMNYTFDIYEYNGSGALISYSTAASNNATTGTATYTWNVASGNWSAPGSWTPARNIPSTTDILIFDGSNAGSTTTPHVSVDISDNIGQLIFKNNVNAALTVSAARTLTINGDGNTSSTDFVINSGSTMNATNTGAFALTINIVTGSKGQIDGTANFNGTAAAAFKLESVDNNSLIVNGTVSTGSNFSSNVFGPGTGASGVSSVLFNNGSTFIQGGGANPFVLTAPASVVTFSAESNFKFTANNNPSIAGRTYGNFEYNSPGNTTIAFTNNTGIGTIAGNLLVSGGSLIDTATANNLNIGGNITVNAGDTLKYYFPNSTHTAGITLNGTSDQTITNNGVLTLGAGAVIVLKKTSGNVILGSDITFNGISSGSGNVANIVLDNHKATLTGGISPGGSTGAWFAGSSLAKITCTIDVGQLFFVQTANTLDSLTLSTSSSSAEIGNPLNIASTGGINVASNVNTSNALILDDALTLKSDANGTASIGKNTSGFDYIINGNTGSADADVTVERYIPANSERAWRLLSVPTQTAQSINAAWQEGQTGQTNSTPGYGTIITASTANSNWAADGFDTVQIKSSILTYNPGSNAWDEVPSMYNSLATVSGYFLYIRGDRSEKPSGTTGPTTATVLRATGPLYQTDQSPISVTGGQYGLIGNTYASSIDFTKLGRDAGIDNKFYVWDPKLLDAPPSLGAYVTFSQVNNWVPVPGSAGVGSYGNIADSILQSGQAFFVHASSTGNITLTENSKVSGSVMVFRPEGGESISGRLTTNLYGMSGATATLADGNVAVFNSAYSDAVDGNDALKLSNTIENFGLLRNGKVLVIEARLPITGTDTLYFDMWNMRQQQYKLEFNADNLNTNGLTAYLEDSYLGTKTSISLNSTADIAFTVDANAGSSASNRFRIVFTGSTPVPVTFTNITAASKGGDNVSVSWQVGNEIGIQQYEVEHSTDGVNFTPIGQEAAKSSNGVSEAYNWSGAGAIDGVNYYRVKSIAISGTIQYTSIARVVIGSSAPGINVYPNPVTNNHINLELTNQPSGKYTVRLLSMIGQQLYRTELNHAGGSATQSIDITGKLAAGVYKLEVATPGSMKYLSDVIIK